MFVIDARNVNEAWLKGLRLMAEVGESEPSRNGSVIVAPAPVTTIYNHPTERVLFDERRDANPFFHLFESLWMLAGRNDAEFLDRYVKDFGSRYAEEDGLLWGAYGFRWREHFGEDQLEAIVQRLRRDPKDRRVVLQMWDPSYDLIAPEDIEEDGTVHWPAGPEPRDLPCNTQVYFRVRQELGSGMLGNQEDRSSLDMTVCCRSNDMIWGAYGANAVHFSVLLEYMAARIGVKVGRYYQVSNNFHVYTAVADKMFGTNNWAAHTVDPEPDPYSRQINSIRPRRMFDVPSEIDRDIERFLNDPTNGKSIFGNPWFAEVARPMAVAHYCYRQGDLGEALRNINNDVQAEDWRMAAGRWITKRIK